MQNNPQISRKKKLWNGLLVGAEPDIVSCFAIWVLIAFVSLLLLARGRFKKSFRGKTKESKKQMKNKILSLVLFLVVAQVFGQEAPVLDNLEVEAYKFEFDELSVPSNNTYISRDDILNSSAVSVTEILQNKANLVFRSTTASSLNGDIAMRGYGENSMSRILVMVNSRKINPADLGAVNWLQIPLDNIESVEVLRGSHSAIYGNGAVAGVIKIKTLKGKDENSIGARLVAGSYGLYSLNLNLLGSYGDFYASVEGSILYDDGYRDNSTQKNNSINASIGYDFNEKQSLEFSINYSDNYIEFPGSLSWDDALNNPRKSTLTLPQNGNQDLGLVTATFKNKSAIGEGEISFGANLRYMQWTMWGTWYDNDQYGYSINAKQDVEVREDLKLFAGFDFNFDDIKYDAFLEDTRLNKTEFSNVNRVTIGAYLGADYEPIEKFTISSAFRYEAAYTSGKDTRYDASTISKRIFDGTQWISNPNYKNPPTVISQFDESMWQTGLAANIGLNYRINDNTSVFFRFDQIYRYPSTDEIAEYQGYGGFARPFNPDLDPEHGQNYEVGAKYFYEGFSCVVNFFYQHLNNEITFDAIRSENINLPPTERYGLDFSMSYDDEFWGASVMASIVDARFTSGQYKNCRIPLVPFYTITNMLYIKPLENLTISAKMRYLSDEVQGLDFTNEYRKIPDYCVFDFQINYKPCKYAEVFFAVDNAFDKRYISAGWYGGFYPACGRFFKVGVNLKY